MKLIFNFKKDPSIRKDLFKSWISGKGLKATKQREKIIDIFLNSSGHQNLSQIYARVASVDPKIGYTTVYRTLELLARFGLAAKRKFADDETCYEPITQDGHHDHLICLDCGKIIEFEDEALETLQDGIANRYHFKVFHHRMELYGHCADCDLKRRTLRRKR